VTAQLLLSGLAVVAGLGVAGAGLWAANRPALAAWKRWGGAVVTPVGVLLALAGAVGLAVPGFYG